MINTTFSPCGILSFPLLLLLEKYHNKMITSNNTIITQRTPITLPAMIPIDGPPAPLSLLPSAGGNFDTTDDAVVNTTDVVVVNIVDVIGII